jgi:predicted RNase H-like HicB family nuclease
VSLFPDFPASTARLHSGTSKEGPPINNLREVRHCPDCGSPLIHVPVVTCAHCGKQIALRAFTYSPQPGQYIAECIDLDLLSQGNTLEEVIGKLQEAMFSYLDVAFAEGSTKGLVLRPSPLSHRLRYHLQRLGCRLARLPWPHARHLLPATSELGSQRLSHC